MVLKLEKYFLHKAFFKIIFQSLNQTLYTNHQYFQPYLWFFVGESDRDMKWKSFFKRSKENPVVDDHDDSVKEKVILRKSKWIRVKHYLKKEVVSVIQILPQWLRMSSNQKIAHREAVRKGLPVEIQEVRGMMRPVVEIIVNSDEEEETEELEGEGLQVIDTNDDKRDTTEVHNKEIEDTPQEVESIKETDIKEAVQQCLAALIDTTVQQLEDLVDSGVASQQNESISANEDISGDDLDPDFEWDDIIEMSFEFYKTSLSFLTLNTIRAQQMYPDFADNLIVESYHQLESEWGLQQSKRLSEVVQIQSKQMERIRKKTLRFLGIPSRRRTKVDRLNSR